MWNIFQSDIFKNRFKLMNDEAECEGDKIPSMSDFFRSIVLETTSCAFVWQYLKEQQELTGLAIC
ncbi:3369_t:CDS:2 [Acaulospora morrowiae]|uniref:3369_t:CDS:1 n=1 Tax=Acaulospora morrowiae TaxID=94023 RepID=A0A9N9H0H5_9GLOM|nr:3369_t:CDS:2 [Acaulospora morrowiae]